MKFTYWKIEDFFQNACSNVADKHSANIVCELNFTSCSGLVLEQRHHWL